MGDSADGYPGLPGWGAKSSAAILAKYSHLELIPRDWREWLVNAANASGLAHTLFSRYDEALLFRRLATLRTDIALFDEVEQLRWTGPTEAFAGMGARLDAALLRRSESCDRQCNQAERFGGFVATCGIVELGAPERPNPSHKRNLMRGGPCLFSGQSHASRLYGEMDFLCCTLSRCAAIARSMAVLILSPDMPEQATAIPPHVQLIQMGTGCWISRLVWTAAKLGIADHLANGSRSAAQLAGLTRTNPRALHRFMRTLASLGILKHEADQEFALTQLGEALKSDAPGSARSTILVMAGPWMWKAWEEFQYSVETGETAMEKVFGLPAFDYLAHHPELATQFSEAMVGIHGPEPAAVAAAYDFSRFGVIVDVGGATGNMLAHVLARYPESQGVLFDLPHVVAEAPALLRVKGVESRVRIECGSFFETVPGGGDAYILSHIVHDWKEDRCLTILGNCRKAMKRGAKLLLVEFVLPEGNTPHFGKLLDMVMLAIPGGEERTAIEYGNLLTRAGLKMTRLVPTASEVSIVEAELT